LPDSTDECPLDNNDSSLPNDNGVVTSLLVRDSTSSVTESLALHNTNSTVGSSTVSSEAAASDQSSAVRLVKEELMHYYSPLATKLENDPKTFLPAVKAFLKSAEKPLLLLTRMESIQGCQI